MIATCPRRMAGDDGWVAGARSARRMTVPYARYLGFPDGHGNHAYYRLVRWAPF